MHWLGFVHFKKIKKLKYGDGVDICLVLTKLHTLVSNYQLSFALMNMCSLKWPLRQIFALPLVA